MTGLKVAVADLGVPPMGSAPPPPLGNPGSATDFKLLRSAIRRK